MGKVIKGLNTRLGSLDEQFNVTALIVFILIIIANIVTLVFNANELQDKDLLNSGKRDDERKNFNVVNSMVIVVAPIIVSFIIFLVFWFKKGGWPTLVIPKTGLSNKILDQLSDLKYQMFWIPLFLAIIFLIFSNFVNSLRNVKNVKNVKNVETDEGESVSVAGLVISFISFGVFMGYITYIVTN